MNVAPTDPMTVLNNVSGEVVAQTPEPAISVEQVSKRFRLYRDRTSSIKETVTRRFRSRFDEFWAIRDLSLEIPRGRTLGLIGNNGSGKSTLLRLMAGIHPPTKGTIATHGRISALLELGAGFHPELTGRENIYLNAAILGLPRREVDEVIDEIIDFAGIEEFIDSPVKVYSSGMYVRLGFAVAVHVNPEILFIDEVIAVGDEEFQRRCLDYLYRLRRRGVTIVLVSHAHGLMQTMCDEVAWLDHGRLVEKGDPATVVRHYLEAVNRTEGERLDAEAGAKSGSSSTEGFPPAAASPSDRSERGARRRLDAGGDATVRITAVDVIGSDGRPTRASGAGDPLTVRLSFAATGSIVSPAFGIRVASESGVEVIATNTVFHAVQTGTITGRGHVDFTIPRLPLMPGGYFIDAAVTDSSMLHTFDQRLEEVTLHVQPGSSCERAGLIDSGGSWTTPVLSDGRTTRASLGHRSGS
jgi:ABC-2 type transport system ATP-binding protein/lipopolysaccharide transport system ATP-binding protein